MATVVIKNTKFTFSVLCTEEASPFWARVKIAVCNEYIAYEELYDDITVAEVEEFLFSASRLLAGGYGTEYSLYFERAGIAVDLYPYTKAGKPTPREERRLHDCVMAVRILLRSKQKSSFLGGVVTLLFHRAEIENFLKALRKEYEENLFHRVHGTGEYAFVGVSPLGYVGCNYLYLDERKEANKGDYVWVRMGRHNTEQIVYVDGVFRYDEGNAPYPLQTVKRILRKATDEEVKNCKIDV